MCFPPLLERLPKDGAALGGAECCFDFGHTHFAEKSNALVEPCSTKRREIAELSGLDRKKCNVLRDFEHLLYIYVSFDHSR